MKQRSITMLFLSLALMVTFILTGCPPAKSADPAPKDSTPPVAIDRQADAPAPDPAPAPVPINEPVAMVVPPDKLGLFAWLKTGMYKEWAHDAQVHESNSPHKMVQTYINSTLEASMAAGNEVHPVGSAAVKELWTDGVHTGWSVETKAQDDSAGGAGWFWFQAASIDDESKISVAERGAAGCVGCHTGGHDFVLIKELVK